MHSVGKLDKDIYECITDDIIIDDQRIKKCKEITDRIEQIESEDEKDVLMYKYIELKNWEDICIKMRLSWKQVHRIHARALKNFE